MGYEIRVTSARLLVVASLILVIGWLHPVLAGDSNGQRGQGDSYGTDSSSNGNAACGD
jgi:hypothetical protein